MGPGDTNADIRTSIEMGSVKASLQSDGSLGDAFGLKTDGQNLLQIFSTLQKLLSASSLGSCDITGAKRYDHQISQDFLPERDRHDQKVAEVAQELLTKIDEQFDLE